MLKTQGGKFTVNVKKLIFWLLIFYFEIESLKLEAQFFQIKTFNIKARLSKSSNLEIQNQN